MARRITRDDTGTTVADIGLLVLRLGTGALLAGHGAQKLFGMFGGSGLDGTARFLGGLGLEPPKAWALLAGTSEFGGGALLALGLGGPTGPIIMQGAMVNAIRQTSVGKPIWASKGGPETAILYSVIGTAVGTMGPGRFSLDHVLGVKVPAAISVATMAAVAAGIAISEAQTAAAKAEAATAATDSQNPAAEPAVSQTNATSAG